MTIFCKETQEIQETITYQNSTNSSARQCFHCESEHLIENIASGDNHNGNAGRLYLRCEACGNFQCWLDARGCSVPNPLCLCGWPSRRQVAGNQARSPGSLHFVCEHGRCWFDEEALDQNGKQVVVAQKRIPTATKHNYI
ncbi:hypothetical protein N7474_006530 [Penicillium riverlandense]|uniref:uncharacterized protein n=1 Tax=Penicillium riverlandense TaxID=1903569 RepID=UPI002546EFB1|nr:uncharacterized protein N7474_006530 [Penicillium riverlandense]KAJ5814753.1 hypothetical protein N7474_006530 [Penicillium riverlandense]